MTSRPLREAWDSVVLAWISFRYRCDLQDNPEILNRGFNRYAYDLYYEWAARYSPGGWTADRHRKITRLLKSSETACVTISGKSYFKSQLSRGYHHWKRNRVSKHAGKRAPKHTGNRAPKDTGNCAPQDVGNQEFTGDRNPRNRAPEVTESRAPQRATSRAPEDSTNRASEVTKSQALEGCTDQAPEGARTRAPEDSRDRAPVDTRDRAPVDSRYRALEDAMDQAPEGDIEDDDAPEDEDGQNNARREDNGERLRLKLIFYWVILEYLELRFQYYAEEDDDFRKCFVAYVTMNWPMTLVVPDSMLARTTREMSALAKLYVDERAGDCGRSRTNVSAKNSPARTSRRVPDEHEWNYEVEGVPKVSGLRRLVDSLKRHKKGCAVNPHRVLDGPSERSGQTPAVAQ